MNNTEINNLIGRAGFVWMDGIYVNTTIRNLHCRDILGYEYLVNINNVQKHPPTKFGYGNPYTINNINIWLIKNNISATLVSDKFINATEHLNWKCLKCNSVFPTSWNKIQQFKLCPYCCPSPRKVNHTNSIRTVNNELIKYFKNESDCDNHTSHSNKKVDLICPNCKCEKPMVINTFVSKGFSCPICSDGISIPEKFGIYLLKQLNISFETQKVFNWAKDKRYDFYIPSLDVMIESHGNAHYSYNGFSTFTGGKTLEEEISNDTKKLELALLHNIELDNYIVIDCRKSEFEFLKFNYVKSLENHFDLSSVNWDKVWEDCQKSIVPLIWDAWNNKNTEDTTLTISSIFCISKMSVVRYLKIGTLLGRCYYSTKEEMIKNGKRNGKMNLKNQTINHY